VLNKEGISGEKWTKVVKNQERKKPDYWVVKPAIAKHVKPMTENCAKGGYHAPLSNARISQNRFSVACIQAFLRAKNWRLAVLSRGSRRDQKRFHQAGVGKTANSLLKDGAKIDLKNERKIIRQTPPKSWANVRSKVRPKRRGPNRISSTRA
jgi:hypothetical protein